MILIYPALVSENIPVDMLPAVTKMLERYILTYSMSDIMNQSRNKEAKFVKGDIKKGDAKLSALLREKVDIEILDEALTSGPPGGDANPFRGIKGKEIETVQWDTENFKKEMGILQKDIAQHTVDNQEEVTKSKWQGKHTEIADVVLKQKTYEEASTKRENDLKYVEKQIAKAKFEIQHQEGDKLREIQKTKNEAIAKKASLLKDVQSMKLNRDKYELDLKKYNDEINKRKNEETLQTQKINQANFEIANRQDDLDRQVEKHIQDVKQKKITIEKDRESIVQNYVKFKGDMRKQRRENAKVDVSTIQMSNELTLEPTYQKIDTADGPMILGVKVVPFNVKSDVGLVELLLNDAAMNKMQGKVQGFLRSMKRKLWNAYYTFTKKIPILKHFTGRPGTITQDPMKDIIYGQTSHKNRVFAIIDKNEIDNVFFEDAGGVKRLFKLGWNNLVFIDDINKRGIFCMKQFKGLCSTISFPTMFSSLGNRGDLYKSLEDSRAASSPFFRTKKSKSRLFGEGAKLASTKMLEYKFLNEDIMLQEDISSFTSMLNKISIPSLIKQLKGTDNGKNVKEVKKVLEKNKIKKIPSDNLLKIGSKYHKDFNKTYSYAFKVINNSITTSDKNKKNFSIIMACLGLMKSNKNNSDPIVETKNVLKQMIPKFRLFDDEGKNMKHITRVLITAIIGGVVVFNHNFIIGVLIFLTVIAMANRVFGDDSDSEGEY